MKSQFLQALLLATVLAGTVPPARAAETDDEKIIRLEAELAAAKKAKIARLEAEIAQASGAAPAGAAVADPEVLAPRDPPAPRAEMLLRSEGETAAQRVERAKSNLQTAIARSAPGDRADARDGGSADADVALAAEELANAKAEDQGEAKASKDFLNLGLGVGLSFTLGLGKDRITGATLDPNGIVRVSDKDNAVARVMLEAHQFFGLDKGETAEDGTRKHRYGVGPFVAIQPGDGEVIDAIGGGVMFGFRPDIKSPKSFNLGFGVVVDPNTQLLGDGIVANQPLPTGETEIRFKKTASYGALFLTSFAF
ncbi:MAG: hypothetical protein P0Y56_06565 [Candidatus Andeanibacterium colombiense]|uniref:Outer membrane protein beta-barrel domain-containing protein n=1 Tax=Candidatus Andeanibacterium colombiense TaxID=3121345 RepID=A0AAJ5X549_9SPHN|nr:MAG: hypothetical protein P0Y56_06565 [Sphingomonadaceae bacterium]